MENEFWKKAEEALKKANRKARVRTVDIARLREELNLFTVPETQILEIRDVVAKNYRTPSATVVQVRFKDYKPVAIWAKRGYARQCPYGRGDASRIRDQKYWRGEK